MTKPIFTPVQVSGPDEVIQVVRLGMNDEARALLTTTATSLPSFSENESGLHPALFFVAAVGMACAGSVAFLAYYNYL